MEEVIVILLIIAGGVLVLPIVAVVKAVGASRDARQAKLKVDQLEDRAEELERVVRLLARHTELAPPAAAAGTIVPAKPEQVTRPEKAAPPPADDAARPVAPAAKHPVPAPAPPPPLPPKPAPRPAAAKPDITRPAAAPAVASPPPARSASLEQFMGVKLFAWLGGIAMFFGVIFFVKYAFERNLIPPALRVALGFITGAGILVGGLWLHRRKAYRVLAQSLCATGVLILYGVSFAAHAVYHFAAFSPPVTFALMTLVTAAAFLIAVRLDALVVAVLGMIGGFLSPILLPSVPDNVFALFSYIALLDLGLLAVARHRSWGFLALAAAIGTALMQLRWFIVFFAPERYFEGAATLVPIGIFTCFAGLFLLAAWWTKRSRPDDILPSLSALGMTSVSMLFAFAFLAYPDITGRPFLLYGFVLALNAAALTLAAIEPRLVLAQVGTALATFAHLAAWTVSALTPELLGSALAIYLVFGALHAVYPVLRSRRRPDSLDPVTGRVSPWFAPLVLVLMLITVLVLPEVPLIVWPAILIADLLVIGLALGSGAIAPVIASLVLTLVVAAAWLLRAPAVIGSLAPLLAVVVVFGALFATAGVWLGRHSAAADDATGPAGYTRLTPATALPVLSGLLPFGLLILAVQVLPVADPSPVFGVTLLLGLLLLGLSLLGRQPLLAPVALLCTLAVEWTWHANRFDAAEPWMALAWILGFYVIFTAFPFVFRKVCADRIEPWATSALSGAGHFLLVHDIVRRAFPNDMMGLVPASFAIPAILALLAVLRTARAMDRTRRGQLAWFGGVALLFITLIFPIQFDRQWLTVSWALEGAALVWLFRRVPHPGLKWTGLVLLAVSFARLALNPAVHVAYPRSGTAIFNWHLYAFGLVAAALILGAKWLPEADRRIRQVNLRAVLYGLAGVLLFLLLNIEIADFFTEPGERFVAFRFAGNFARDMTYSIAWGLYSLGLLGLGIWFHAKPLRFAAIGLLGLTLLKVFLHDLSTIENIYRIGALVGVAVIAFIASFLYQQFFSRSEKP